MIEGKGKFRYESKRAKTGRLTIPSKIVSDSTFPLNAGSSVKITLENNGVLIVEPIYNGRIENVNSRTITVCRSRDCKNCNKDNNVCIINHEISKSGCLSYEKDITFLNQSLKEFLNNKNKIRGKKIGTYPTETVKNLEELDRILDKKMGDNNAI